MSLIAAAPDLLAALEAVLAHVEDMDLDRAGGTGCTLCRTYRVMIREAIAKARAPHEQQPSSQEPSR